VAKARFVAVISGEVQMVGFRAFAQRHAERLGIQGWARNTPAGNVEVLAEGEEAALNSFLDLLREGPRLAEVSDVQVRWEEPKGDLRAFSIRW
jgi:acylphosphatase